MSVLCGLGLLSATPLLAQTTKTLGRGATLALTADDGYKTYQWQVSSDNQVFTDLPDGAQKDLSIKVYIPGYYRAKAVKADGSVSYIDATTVATTATTYNRTDSISASQGFVEVNGQPSESISMPENPRTGMTLTMKNKLTNWSNASASAVYFFRHGAGVVDSKMLITATAGSPVRFRLTVTDPDKPTVILGQTYIAFQGTGKEQVLDFFGCSFPTINTTTYPRGKYYRYQLDCLEGNKAINNIRMYGVSSASSVVNSPSAYLSSPSVHLNGWSSTKAGAPAGASYDWAYQEVMIPTESYLSGTYVMSLGVLRGYMGIQVNGTNKEVIFSMWDDGSTDTDPNLANHKKAGAVDWNQALVTPNRFGNEGTGIQCMCRGNLWELDKYVQFIANARPETVEYYTVSAAGDTTRFTQENTLVSAWFNAQDGKGWQYIATDRLPSSGKFFDSWYSFLENYNYPSGQLMRKGYYRNGYAHARTANKWYHFNKVWYGNTDNGSEVTARYDFGQGPDPVDKKAFFMTTGGFTANNRSTVTTVPLNTVDTPVDTILLKNLEARVDQGLAKEQAEQAAADSLKSLIYSKTGWTIYSKSGETTAGKATYAIDNSETTYWDGNSTSCNIVVDMGQKQDVDGLSFTQGSDHRIKGLTILYSNNGITWPGTAYKSTAVPEASTFYAKFDAPANFRYFKVLVTSVYSGGSPRLYEVGATRPATNVGITNVTTSSASANKALTLYYSTDGSTLNVVAPKTAAATEITLYSLAGNTMKRQTYYNIPAGDVEQISLSSLIKGVYIVKVVADGETYSQKISVQ